MTEQQLLNRMYEIRTEMATKTVAELKQLASVYGVQVGSKAKKADLVKAVAEKKFVKEG